MPNTHWTRLPQTCCFLCFLASIPSDMVCIASILLRFLRSLRFFIFAILILDYYHFHKLLKSVNSFTSLNQTLFLCSDFHLIGVRLHIICFVCRGTATPQYVAERMTLQILQLNMVLYTVLFVWVVFFYAIQYHNKASFLHFAYARYLLM